MAKGVKKTISIYLDGKQVENSAKAIQKQNSNHIKKTIFLPNQI